MEEKLILDACCGGKHMWFQKQQKNTIFMDIRQEKKGTIKVRPNWCVEPDTIGDYRKMQFPDNSFKLIVWDIPHMLGKRPNCKMQKVYGCLNKTYKKDLKNGFNEIMRILDDYGVLEFKYSDISISVKEILELFKTKPLFGTVTKKGVNNTYWFCFMKIPTVIN